VRSLRDVRGIAIATTGLFDVPLPGSISTSAWDLNNNHQIVGAYGDFLGDYFVGFLTTY
jgi:hypothetical protein